MFISNKSPKNILVVNGKGGCGKTTIATNLSSYYASRHFPTALVDHDPQGSSSFWLKSRPHYMEEIYGVSAFKPIPEKMTKTFALRIPQNIEKVVIDTPAGIQKESLDNLINKSDVIIIPVLPSPIDINALALFLKNLLLFKEIKSHHIRIAIVANRVKENTISFRKLNHFLRQIHIPLVTQLRESQHYAKTSENGVGIHDINSQYFKKDIEQWHLLIDWIDAS